MLVDSRGTSYINMQLAMIIDLINRNSQHTPRMRDDLSQVKDHCHGAIRGGAVLSGAGV